MTGISPVYHSSDAQKYGCFSATTVIFGEMVGKGHMTQKKQLIFL